MSTQLTGVNARHRAFCMGLTPERRRRGILNGPVDPPAPVSASPDAVSFGWWDIASGQGPA